MIKDLTFITGNPHKKELLEKHLGIEVNHHKLDLDEIQSVDPKEVISHKVRQAHQMLKKPIIVEDASLIINAWGKLPGPLIKWFIQEVGLIGICRMLNNFEDKTAIGIVGFGFYDGNEIKVFIHEVQGSIPNKPLGENGFGWDPIFVPDGFTKTWAEMKDEERNLSYVRFPAMKKLEDFLRNYG